MSPPSCTRTGPSSGSGSAAFRSRERTPTDGGTPRRRCARAHARPRVDHREHHDRGHERDKRAPTNDAAYAVGSPLARSSSHGRVMNVEPDADPGRDPDDGRPELQIVVDGAHDPARRPRGHCRAGHHEPEELERGPHLAPDRQCGGAHECRQREVAGPRRWHVVMGVGGLQSRELIGQRASSRPASRPARRRACGPAWSRRRSGGAR